MPLLFSDTVSSLSILLKSVLFSRIFVSEVNLFTGGLVVVNQRTQVPGVDFSTAIIQCYCSTEKRHLGHCNRTLFHFITKN